MFELQEKIKEKVMTSIKKSEESDIYYYMASWGKPERVLDVLH